MVTNSIVKEAYGKVQGNRKKFHSVLCEMAVNIRDDRWSTPKDRKFKQVRSSTTQQLPRSDLTIRSSSSYDETLKMMENLYFDNGRNFRRLLSMVTKLNYSHGEETSNFTNIFEYGVRRSTQKTSIYLLTRKKCGNEVDAFFLLLASGATVADNILQYSKYRQILSVLSKTLSFQGMSQKIQGITEYRYYIAKKHSSVYGCALPSPNTEHHRQRMDPPKLDIFLDFITSSHIIKDLPFGDKMRLSSGKITETHNVIKCMAPAAIIQQFKQYCAENEEIPLGEFYF
ncbi:unnamed protein product [Mytilus coruscus]|uniref:Uncharacterized protein n=1 Tax=Mytilus coruscus TaxID=42192 RepID=A0A6J8D6N1_MYTCO|nr:unnamed protein product [Mytilus coruscus]